MADVTGTTLGAGTVSTSITFTGASSFTAEARARVVSSDNVTASASDAYPPTGADENGCRGSLHRFCCQAPELRSPTPPTQLRTFSEAPSSTDTPSIADTGSDPPMTMPPPLPPLSVHLPIQELGSIRSSRSVMIGTHPWAPTSEALLPTPGEGLPMLPQPSPAAPPMPPTVRLAVSTPYPQKPPSTRQSRPLPRPPSARPVLAPPPSATNQPPPTTSPLARPPLPSPPTLPRLPIPTAARLETGTPLLTPEVCGPCA